MKGFRVTVKNYRCFEDTQPLTVEFGSGFTGLVGPNNSGKSSFLRLFYEMRDVFNTLTNQGTLVQVIANNATFDVRYPGTEDPSEIFHDRNDRPLSIMLELYPQNPGTISRVALMSNRATPNRWQAQVAVGPNYRRATAVAGQGPDTMTLALEGGGAAGINFREFVESIQFLTQSFYVGAFRSAIGTIGGDLYDIKVGAAFIDTWNEWKTGTNRTHNQLIQAVESDITHIFGYDRLEINATTGGEKTLQVIVNGKPYRLREVGAGLAQFIIVFGNVAIRRPTWLLIDEPELNLHPSLQVDFLTSLTSYSKYGVMFATHSLGLGRTVADHLYAFQKPAARATARLFEQTPHFAEFLGEMSFASFKELGYESILLVEGVTDVKTVQQFLKLFDKDHKVVVVPLGGTQMIRAGVELELAEVKRLSTKVSVLIDSERATEGAALSPERQAFVTSCEGLGFSVCVTHRRAIENYLSENAVGITFAGHHALPFYQRVGDANPSWHKGDNWRIARNMTRAELEGTDVGNFIGTVV